MCRSAPPSRLSPSKVKTDTLPIPRQPRGHVRGLEKWARCPQAQVWTPSAQPHQCNGWFSRALLPRAAGLGGTRWARLGGGLQELWASMGGFSGCLWGEDSLLIQTDVPERREPRTAAGAYTNVAPTSPRSPGCCPPRPLWLQAGGQQVGGQERDHTGAREPIDLSPAAAGNPQGTWSRVGQNSGPRSRARGPLGAPGAHCGGRWQSGEDASHSAHGWTGPRSAIQHRGWDSARPRGPRSPRQAKATPAAHLAQAPHRTLAAGPYAAWRLQPRGAPTLGAGGAQQSRGPSGRCRPALLSWRLRSRLPSLPPPPPSHPFRTAPAANPSQEPSENK